METFRIALLLAYDGRFLSGWQIQPHDVTVQGLVEEALTSLAKIPVRVTGAGRTDAGVSAWAQVAHADLPSGFPIPLDRLARVLNTRLPPEIRLLDVRPVPRDFHARHSAKGKVYKYSFRLLPEGLTRHPLADPFSSPIRAGFDLARVVEASKFFLGEHDFRHFSVASSLPEDPVRKVTGLFWEALPAGFALWITGPGFLHRMVRMIGGFLKDVGEGRRSASEIPSLLRPGAPPSFRPVSPLPPEGLSLVRVLYGAGDPFDPRAQN
ncbi:MAG: tRNA pseudouridine(38-40) synthase TruA [Nitrospirae bacterium]|nr:tRNA pseudouridine(38-40) synthase TruA [Nitrospirota bacterium]MCL5285804.1 tRNA pseudouridine(38-40) synthase TruA [Nitrospirota bacterium]